MRRRPWWMLRPADDDEPDEGRPDGPGKVQVPTHLDPLTGEADETVWCDPDAADQWDVRRWKRAP